MIDLEIKLETQARAAGGEFRALVGNHELMWLQGRTSFYHANDPKSFQAFASSPQSQDGPRGALMGPGPYADWLAKQNTIEMINGTLFVHAGFGSWGKWVSAGTVNRWVHNWILYYQGTGPKPPIWTRWVIGQNGPLFNRELAPPSLQSTVASLSDKNLRAILKKYGAKRIVIGHSRVLSVETALQHPLYGSRVISADVDLSVAYRGPLVAYVHHDDSVEAITVDRQSGKIISRAFTADHISSTGPTESSVTPVRCEQVLQ